MKEEILIYTDTHYRCLVLKGTAMPFGERAFFCLADHFLPTDSWNKTAENAFNRMLEKIETSRLFDSIKIVVDMGDGIVDISYGSFSVGLGNDKAMNLWLEYNKRVVEAFEKRGIKVYSLVGNHDLGYQSFIGKIIRLGNWGKGLTRKSFERGREVIGKGETWKKFEHKGCTFVLLDSEVIRALRTLSSILPEERNYFGEQVEEQKVFLEESLKKATGKVILVIHDPWMLKFLWPVICPYQDKIQLTLAGHLHSATSGRVLRFKSIFRKLSLKVIPAPWLSMSRLSRHIVQREGGGFATLAFPGCVLKNYWLK